MRRAESRSTTHPADTPAALSAVAWLGRDSHGASVLSTAKAMLAAERDVQRTLPAALAQTCRVARIEAARITLAVPTGALAAKLRQMAPRIMHALNQRGRNLSEVVVRVQAHLPQDDAKTAHARDVIPLDDAALRAFAELQKQIRPGPVADAIARLLDHHGRR